jgi:hypothetical protein
MPISEHIEHDTYKIVLTNMHRTFFHWNVYDFPSLILRTPEKAMLENVFFFVANITIC